MSLLLIASKKKNGNLMAAVLIVNLKFESLFISLRNYA